MKRPLPLVPRIVALCLLFLATGCAVTVPTISPVSATRAADRVLALTASSTAGSSSPTPTATATPRPTLANSPLPTLPPNEAQALVLELLEHNAGCRLPCWWGFSPGGLKFLAQQGRCETPRSGCASSAHCVGARSRGPAHA